MYPRPIIRLCPSIKRHYSVSTLLEYSSAKKVQLAVTEENQFELLSDVITPLWKLDYVEQILLKKNWCKEVVEKIKSHRLPRAKTRIHKIIPSPSVESYRNKDEFSVRKGIDGNPKTVGFFLGSPAHGEVVCVPPTKLISLKEEHIFLSQVYQDIIRNSPLKANHDLHDGGFWRNITVRSNRKGELMVIVVVHPDGASEEELEEVKVILKERFLEACPNLCSLYLQACQHVRCTSDQAPFVLLHGQEHLYETLSGIDFRISPGSFFQVNTEAASLLYENTLKYLEVDNRTTLLDLCCGVGCCSLIASKEVRGCIGIESMTSSIEDANFNAEFNEITNCNYISGNIEKKLFNVLVDLNTASDIVPFINPGRAGLNRNVAKLLRRSSNIERLAYVSCKANGYGAIKNFVDLCSLKADNSPPFILTDVLGVDMFPQTHHCELIFIFQR